MNNFWDFLGTIIKTIIVFVGSYAMIALLLLGLFVCLVFK